MANTTFRRLLNNSLTPNTNCPQCNPTPAFGYEGTLCNITGGTIAIDSIGGFDNGTAVLLPTVYQIPSFVEVRTSSTGPLICAEITSINLTPQQSTHFIDIANGTFTDCNDCTGNIP